MIIDSVQALDHRVEELIGSRQHMALDRVFSSFTSLGSTPFNLLILAYLILTARYAMFQQLGLALLATWTVIYPVKYAVRRERPEKHEYSVVVRTSFPSGHSGNSFATATILSTYLGLNAFFFGLAAIVAFSRLYLEDHFLSDVLVGAAIGLSIGYAVVLV